MHAADIIDYVQPGCSVQTTHRQTTLQTTYRLIIVYTDLIVAWSHFALIPVMPISLFVQVPVFFYRTLPGFFFIKSPHPFEPLFLM